MFYNIVDCLLFSIISVVYICVSAFEQNRTLITLILRNADYYGLLKKQKNTFPQHFKTQPNRIIIFFTEKKLLFRKKIRYL